jgi:metallo-beta-lactamase family protein
MFQGSPNEAERNRLPFAFDPAQIDAVVLTHAHLDHSGMLPRLVMEGFRGPIYATAGTAELAGLVLLDAAKLQSEFARRAARRERRRAQHVPRDAEAELRAQSPSVATTIEEPLYEERDVHETLARFRPCRYGDDVSIASGVTARVVDAGHILGSAIVVLRAEDRTVVFSGDLGRHDAPIVRDPSVVTDADYVLLETTYGGRVHEGEAEAAGVLAAAVNAVNEAGGVLLVPAFAIGRTQDLVWELDRLLAAKRIPRLPLYLDSPMASKATDVYRRHPECFDDEMRSLLARRADPLDYPDARVANDIAASRAIRDAPRPYLLVASNGMLTGGRVLGHLRDLIGDPNATLLFVGYQGEGTLGAHLQAGVKKVVIDGDEREVRCRIRSLDGFSAHADEPGLLGWIGAFADGKRAGDPGFPRRVFLVHGDPAAQRAIEPKIGALGFATHVPTWRERVTLD